MKSSVCIFVAVITLFAGDLLASLGDKDLTASQLTAKLVSNIHVSPSQELDPQEANALVEATIEQWVAKLFATDEQIDPHLLALAIPAPTILQPNDELIRLECQRYVLITRWNYDYLKQCPPLDEEQQKIIVEQIKQWTEAVQESLIKHLGSKIPLLTQEEIKAEVKERLYIDLLAQLTEPLSYQCKLSTSEQQITVDLRQYDVKLQEMVASAVPRIAEANDKEREARSILSQAVRVASRQFRDRTSNPARVKVVSQMKDKAKQEYSDLFQRIRQLQRPLAPSSQPAAPAQVIHP